jgi:hypothetical protein
MPAKPRKKPPPQTTRDYLATLERAIRELSYSQHLFTTFRHFVELSAIAFSNVADPINKAARETQYLSIVTQYKPEEFQKFPPLLGMLVACLEYEPIDVLGSNSITNRATSFLPRTQCVRRWPKCSCMMPSIW